MNKFFLPQLDHIEINDYSLYECPMILDFTKKLNIVFGTNGTGKSTLLMIILFSIIGPYKGGIKTKTRKDQRKDHRPIYYESFFKDRVVEGGENSTVISKFTINKDRYIVTHSLYDGRLLKVKLNDKYLSGKIVTYKTYEMRFSKMRENVNEDNKLEPYLIYEYQRAIKQSTALPGGVNTLINMLLDVMFFDEGRSFTFWNSDLQETIIGKYIVDEQFYEDYCEKKLDTKALESAYKKKSETLNYMKKFFESEKTNTDLTDNKNDDVLRIELLELKDEIKLLENDLNTKRAQYNKKNEDYVTVSQKIEKLRETMNKLDEEWYTNLFPKQYNLYYRKFSRKMSENLCPICGNNHVFTMDTNHCIYCNEELDVEKNLDLVDIDIKRKDYQIKLISKTKELKLIREEMNSLNCEVSEIRKEIESRRTKQQRIEISLKPQDEQKDSDSIRLMRASKEREEALTLYNESKREESVMRSEIEKSLVINFKKFSIIFANYASSFFGTSHEVNVELPFDHAADDNNETFDNLMIQFILDNKKRNVSDMLSESQRIFADLSFRFAILTTFHEKSFFMCETPDSTLDIFHEVNAVNTFMQYLIQGNTLILTANARKSNLISRLCSEVSKEDLNVIDLTKLSKIRLLEYINFDDYLGGNL